MAKTIAVIQNKGGVGKTTVTCNLAAGLAKKYPEKRVLIVDMDAQGNQALSFGIQPRELENTVYDVLVNGLPVKDVIISLSDNLHLVPANDDMNYYELDTLPGLKTEDIRDYLLRLKRALEPIQNEYDYIFVDSPPELKIVAASIMMVADELYIPFEPDAYNAQGLIQLLEKIEIYKEQYDMSPEIKGVIPMKVKPKTILHRGVLVQVDAYCQLKGIRVMKTKIPDSIKYPEFIAAARMPVVWADPHGDHARFYYNLLDEVLGDGQTD
jgi:chromosome partitioning protein